MLLLLLLLLGLEELLQQLQTLRVYLCCDVQPRAVSVHLRLQQRQGMQLLLSLLVHSREGTAHSMSYCCIHFMLLLLLLLLLRDEGLQQQRRT